MVTKRQIEFRDEWFRMAIEANDGYSLSLEQVMEDSCDWWAFCKEKGWDADAIDRACGLLK